MGENTRAGDRDLFYVGVLAGALAGGCVYLRVDPFGKDDWWRLTPDEAVRLAERLLDGAQNACDCNPNWCLHDEAADTLTRALGDWRAAHPGEGS